MNHTDNFEDSSREGKVENGLKKDEEMDKQEQELIIYAAYLEHKLKKEKHRKWLFAILTFVLVAVPIVDYFPSYEDEDMTRYYEQLRDEDLYCLDDTTGITSSTEKFVWSGERNTPQLVLDALEMLDCNEIHLDTMYENRLLVIKFKYKDNAMGIDILNGAADINLMDLNWAVYDLKNKALVDILFHTINNVNYSFPFKIVFVEDDNHNAVIYSRKNILFIEEIPQPEEYLRAEIESMLNIQEAFIESVKCLQEEATEDKDEIDATVMKL